MSEKEKDVLEEEVGDDGILQLINEDGETLDFFFVASLPYKDEWYAFFQPAEAMEDIDEDEVVVFKVVEGEDGEDVFEPIEDENLLDEVYNEYLKMHEEYEGCGCGCEDCEGECDHEHSDDCDCGCKDKKPE